ncbi:hypothetical protein L9F63_027905, partial [Diploptera punctata]
MFLNFNIKLLHYLGVWPLDTDTKFRKFINFLIIFSVLIQLIFFYITEIIDFYINFGSIQIMTKILCQITNEMPFESWTPFDVSDTNLYILAYILHGIHGGIFIVYMPGCGMFFVGLIYQACVQFLILHYSLKCLKIKIRHLVIDHKKNNGNHKVMTDLNEYCLELEKILNPVMFVQLVTTAAAICVVSFQVNEFNVTFLTMAVFLITVLFECGIYFFAGQELINQVSA